MVNAIKDAKAPPLNNHVLVDGGDQFQGLAVLHPTTSKMAARELNMLGLTASTVGKP